MLYETESLRVTADRGVATLWLDFPRALPNLLTVERLMQIDDALTAVLPNPFIETLVIRSAKLTGFCAGFDVSALKTLATDDDACEFARIGQRVLNRLGAAECTTIAYLHGPCIGPGLELALACDYRLGVAAANSAFGFGDVPICWGGLTQLTRVVGSTRAVEVLLNAGTLSAREAVAVGLVDHAFCERRAKIELRMFLDHCHKKPRRWHTPFDGWAARRVVRAFQQAANHNPFLEVIPAAAASLDSGLRAERAAFAAALQSTAGQAQLSLTTTRQQMGTTPKPALPPSIVAVIGPVSPVADLIVELALRGAAFHLLMTEDSPCYDSELKRVLSHALSRGRVTPLEAELAAKRICNGIPNPLTVNAVIVTLDTAAALAAAEALAGPGVPILCTADRRGMSRYAVHARRLFGLTVHGTLIEIIRGKDSDSRALTAIQSTLNQSSFSTMVVGDRRGSIVRRVRAAYWDEAVSLVADGVPIAAVDAAAMSLGATVGPLEAMDGLGLDTAVQWVPGVQPLLAAGIHGRPESEGFYLLAADSPTGPNAAAQMVLLHAAAPQVQITAYTIVDIDQTEARRLSRERLLLRVINAAATVLADDAYVGPAEIDFAIVEGVGLLAASGGPLRHAESIGLCFCAAQLRTFATQFGDRFKPSAELTRRALGGEAFHDDTPRVEQPLKRSA